MPYKCPLSKAALVFAEIELKEMLRCYSKFIALFIYSEKMAVT